MPNLVKIDPVHVVLEKMLTQSNRSPEFSGDLKMDMT